MIVQSHLAMPRPLAVPRLLTSTSGTSGRDLARALAAAASLNAHKAGLLRQGTGSKTHVTAPSHLAMPRPLTVSLPLTSTAGTSARGSAHFPACCCT